MANNLIQIKRTSVSGRAANTTTLPNPGELALNMTDGILYSGNGSVVFEVGANTTNSRVSGNLSVNSIVANNSVGSAGYVLSSNSSGGAFWSAVVGFAGSKGANSNYTASNIAPTNPIVGDRWYNTDFAAELVYTYDGDSYQWVEISATGPAGTIGPTGYTGSAGTPIQTFTVALSDENYTSITTGTGKVIFRAPYPITLQNTPRASLSTASTSGAVTVDIKINGSSVFGTNKLTIDQGSKTSVGSAVTPSYTSGSSVADDAEISYDITAAGTNAKGLKAVLYFTRIGP